MENTHDKRQEDNFIKQSWLKLESIEPVLMGKGVILHLTATKLNCNILFMRALAKIIRVCTAKILQVMLFMNYRR